MHRAIFLCAGQAKRMAGLIKQFIEIDGERLIDRSVRQCQPLFDKLFLAAPTEEFAVPGVELIVTEDYPPTKASTILRTRRVWNPNMCQLCQPNHCRDRTTFLLGDVCWSEDALQQVVSDKRELVFFGHKERNKITFKPWGELFALSVEGPMAHDTLISACLGQKGSLLWDLFEQLSGCRRGSPALCPFYCEINDEMVDDIDTQGEAEQMAKILKRAKQVA